MKDPDAASLLRINRVLLAIAFVFVGTTVALGIFAVRQSRAVVRLGDLSREQRIALTEQIQRVSPQIYQPFPVSGPPLFYRMAPNTRYENVLGSTFTTNDLGFRAIPTAKQNGISRIVLVGDSWTFGPYVDQDETFSRQLEVLLNRREPRWEAYNLSMVGWNTDNELAALRVFLSQLQPDVVIICPTSNDIDDSLGVWMGGLVNQGFASGAVFRRSFEFERRWTETFEKLDRAVADLEGRKIPTLIYFLAEWRKLAPYYARLAHFQSRYVVVPTEFTTRKYRHKPEVDPGQHASAEGHQRIAAYLFNALIDAGIVKGIDSISLEFPVTHPGERDTPGDAEAELAFWWPTSLQPDLMPMPDGFMGQEGLFSVRAAAGKRQVAVTLRLLDEPSLYPLTVTLELAGDAKTRRQVVVKSFAENPPPALLIRPATLDAFPTLEVRVRADRAVALSATTLASMRRPDFAVN